MPSPALWLCSEPRPQGSRREMTAISISVLKRSPGEGMTGVPRAALPAEVTKPCFLPAGLSWVEERLISLAHLPWTERLQKGLQASCLLCQLLLSPRLRASCQPALCQAVCSALCSAPCWSWGRGRGKLACHPGLPAPSKALPVPDWFTQLPGRACCCISELPPGCIPCQVSWAAAGGVRPHASEQGSMQSRGMQGCWVPLDCRPAAGLGARQAGIETLPRDVQSKCGCSGEGGETGHAAI